MSDFTLHHEEKFEFLLEGTGPPLIFLHGLMGNLSNFADQIRFFADNGYEVNMPKLPLYSLPLHQSTVKHLTLFLKEFVDHRGLDQVVLIGNSLGGHIALMYQTLFPKSTLGIVLAGSSGLYESAMGGSFPRRGDREYIAEKVRDVFEVKSVATEELIDLVFETVGNRVKALKTLSISKSAIRHNMTDELKRLKAEACIIWGRQDTVTPPDVAKKFHDLLPNSELHWIDKCGHAAMMEHPETFNDILLTWLNKLHKQD